MAEVQFSGIGVVDINGSIGGTTFARNFYGAYAKMRIGAPAGSAFLTAWQMNITSLASVWQFGMSDSDRKTWYRVKRYAKDSMANTNVITGFDLYMSVNLNFLQIGIPAVLSPPLSTERLQIRQPEIFVCTPLSLVIAAPVAGAIPCLLSFTKPLPAGRMTNNQIYGYAAYIALSAVPTDYITAYNARFGALTVGSKVFVRLIPISVLSGLRGQPQYVSEIVV